MNSNEELKGTELLLCTQKKTNALLKNISILKKDNVRKEQFESKKIMRAIDLASERACSTVSPKQRILCLNLIRGTLESEYNLDIPTTVKVEKLHDIIIHALEYTCPTVATEYKEYRGYKKRFNKTFSTVMESAHHLLSNGDKDNANKNSQLISTKKELLSGIVSRNISLDYELPKDVSEAHIRGDIYNHDLDDDLLGSINCCLFDMKNVLSDGYTLNGVKNTEPQRVESAISVVSDLILAASSQQFGGFTVPEIDNILGKYAEKSYNRYLKEFEHTSCAYNSRKQYEEWVENYVFRIIKEGYKNSFEYRHNQINNSNGQTSFITETIGIDVSKWGRLCCKAILEARMDGIGSNKITAIFPKIVFLHRQEINGAANSPNYDLKILAVRCSMIRMYPDWLSLDCGYLGDTFSKYNKAISPMGCRAFLSPWYKKGGFKPTDETDEPIFIGRANCGAVSLNLPRYAIQSNKDIDKFYEILDKNIALGIKKHLYKFNKLKSIKASSNPLFFCEGGCHIRLNYDDTIEEAIKTFTWSIGYLGIEETTYYMYGKHGYEYREFGEQILEHISEKLSMYKEKYHMLFALYSTPAESLCYKFLQKDKEEFGIIEGVTDKEYYTNSYHTLPSVGISALDKIDGEAPSFHIATGGRIVFCEFPQTSNFSAMLSTLNYAMRLGLYFGINLQLDTCNSCGHKGEFEFEYKDHKICKCPKCGSTDVISINRVCGYLGYTQIQGESRMNRGKDDEIINREDNLGEIIE